MKKIITILLMILLLPSAFVLSSCKKEEKKTLINFYEEYLAIADTSTYLTETTLTNNSIKYVGFDLSTISSKLGNSAYLEYSYLNSLYLKMLEDAIAPTCLYINQLLTIEVSNADIDYMNNQLKSLKTKYSDAASKLQLLSSVINTATEKPNLANFYDSIESLIMPAINLSSRVNSIYFSKGFTNTNIDYTTKNENNFNVSDLAILTKNRISYYKLAYLNIFMNTKILGKNISRKIINNTFDMNSAEYIYAPYYNLTNKIYSNTQSSNINNNKTELLHLARSLYYIQTTFDNDYQNFIQNVSKINYNVVNSESNKQEQLTKKKINDFILENGIVYQSYSILTQILDLCY